MNPYSPDARPPEQTGQLILSDVPMKGALKIDVRPDRALLFTSAAGVVRLHAYPSLLDRRKYQRRYEVDLGRRAASFTTSVPSQTRAAAFQVTLDVTWGVTDPVAVVEHRLADGLQILRPRLEATARSIGHTYLIGAFIDFEQHLARTLGNRPSYEEGVGVFSCSVRVEQDERYRSKTTELEDAHHVKELTGVKSSWVDTVNSEWSLMQQLLRQDPDSIPQVLDELRKRADGGNERDDERLRLLLSSGLVGDMADLETGMPIIQQTARFDPNDAIDPPRITAQRADALPPADDEDIMPAEIVPEDGVAGWVPPPWQQGGG